MPKNDNHSLILLPQSALANKSLGEDRVLSAMVGETLALIPGQQTTLQAPRFRIGEHELCGPDFRQILRWAADMDLEPLVFLERLTDLSLRCPEVRLLLAIFSEDPRLTRIANGCLVAIHWDLELLPIEYFQPVETLQIEALSFEPKLRRLLRVDLSAVPRLTELHCNRTGITDLDLSAVPGLKELHCNMTGVTKLDLSAVPGLTKLWCGETDITELDLSAVPGLTELHCNHTGITELDLSAVPGLTELHCNHTGITELDLSAVPELTKLDCRWCGGLTRLDLSAVPELTTLNCSCCEGLTELDIRPLEKLDSLSYDVGRIRLIQRPDQNF